jgi:ERCC4-related helicase
MNIQQQEQFYQMMGRLRGSRAASTRVTEVTNGLLVSKPVNKEAEIIDLQEYAKQTKSNAVSVPGINKLKEIQDFINSHGRRF